MTRATYFLKSLVGNLRKILDKNIFEITSQMFAFVKTVTNIFWRTTKKFWSKSYCHFWNKQGSVKSPIGPLHEPYISQKSQIRQSTLPDKKNVKVSVLKVVPGTIHKELSPRFKNEVQKVVLKTWKHLGGAKRQGAESPRERQWAIHKWKRETEISLRLINFVLQCINN